MEKADKVAGEANMGDVDEIDRPIVRAIFKGLLLFDTSLPKLESSVTEKRDHYNLQVRGFMEEISLQRLYETFLGPRRLAEYDNIIKIDCIPSPETGNGPVFRLKIARGNYVETPDEPPKRGAVAGAIEFNDAEVNRVDRAAVSDIVQAIFTFNQIMPQLQLKISTKVDHYNLIVTGWTKAFDLKHWYNTFESTKRDERYDEITKTSCVPFVVDKGPVLVVRVSRTQFCKSVVDKSRKRHL